MKVLFIVVFAVFSVGAASIYYSRNQSPKYYAWLPQESQPVHPGPNKADVRKFCEFLILSRHSFDTYAKKGASIFAQVTIDQVEYKFEYKPSIYVFNLTITDGGDILTISDISADGTVNGSTLAQYSYRTFGFVPQEQPTSQTQITERTDYANRNYEKYLKLLMRYFNLHAEGELSA